MRSVTGVVKFSKRATLSCPFALLGTCSLRLRHAFVPAYPNTGDLPPAGGPTRAQGFFGRSPLGPLKHRKLAIHGRRTRGQVTSPRIVSYRIGDHDDGMARGSLVKK